MRGNQRRHTSALAASLCALALMLSALLAGCEVGGSPAPTPNPTRTLGPGVYRQAPDTRAAEVSFQPPSWGW